MLAWRSAAAARRRFVVDARLDGSGGVLRVARNTSNGGRRRLFAARRGADGSVVRVPDAGRGAAVSKSQADGGVPGIRDAAADGRADAAGGAERQRDGQGRAGGRPGALRRRLQPRLLHRVRATVDQMGHILRGPLSWNTCARLPAQSAIDSPLISMPVFPSLPVSVRQYSIPTHPRPSLCVICPVYIMCMPAARHLYKIALFPLSLLFPVVCTLPTSLSCCLWAKRNMCPL